MRAGEFCKTVGRQSLASLSALSLPLSASDIIPDADPSRATILRFYKFLGDNVTKITG